MFFTLYGTYFSFLMHFKMSSAIGFNRDQSRILSSGNRLKLTESLNKHSGQFLPVLDRRGSHSSAYLSFQNLSYLCTLAFLPEFVLLVYTSFLPEFVLLVYTSFVPEFVLLMYTSFLPEFVLLMYTSFSSRICLTGVH